MSEKQKVYISGPISSRLDTYQADFQAAAELVERAGFIPLNPAILSLGLDKADYMRITRRQTRLCLLATFFIISMVS